jgi:TRAP-type C4-dicarboxylate transport system substrate-binding protein
MRTLLLALAGSTMFGATALAQDIPSLNLRYSAHVPEAFYLSKVDLAFTKEITEKTGGKVTFQHYWSNAFGGEAEMAQMVAVGAVDLATIVTGNNPSLLPLSGVTNAVPFMFFDDVSAVEATRKLFHDNEAVKAEFAAANLKPLIIRHLPEYRLLCRTPVKTIADLSGKKVRTYGAFVPQMFVALNAVPVTVQPLEMNEALERGTVDCLYLTYASIHAFKLHKTAKYLSDINFGTINAYTTFTSQSEWDSWPESLQAIILEAVDHAEKMSLEISKAAEDGALQTMLSEGAELIKFEDQEKLSGVMPDMLEVWAKKMEEQGKGDQAKQIVETIRKPE